MRIAIVAAIISMLAITGSSFADCKNGQCTVKESKAIVDVNVGPLHVRVGGDKCKKPKKCKCRCCKCSRVKK